MQTSETTDLLNKLNVKETQLVDKANLTCHCVDSQESI